MTAETVRRNLLERGSSRADDARFYTRTGLTLILGLAAATALVWTGIWGRMLTWGEWGTLTVPDLLGLLIVGVGLVAVGLFALLFTMRASLRQVEADLLVADRVVDEKVARLHAHVTRQLDATRRMLEEDRRSLERDRQTLRADWQTEAARLSKSMRQSGHEMVAAAVAEEVERLRAHPDKLGPFTDQLAGLDRRLETTRRSMMDLEARYALLEETTAMNLQALGVSQQETEEEVRVGMIRARSELLRSVEGAVREQVSAQLDGHLPAPDRGGLMGHRFYRNLGGGVAAGLGTVGLLALVGAVGPGLLATPTAIFGLGLANVVLATGLLMLIFSFGGRDKRSRVEG